MVKYQSLFDNFIRVVKESTPRNTKISSVLTNVLKIEKEAVYRRLRMEVPFTFTEVAEVCRYLNISVDDILDTKPVGKSAPCMRLAEPTLQGGDNEAMMQTYLELFRQVGSETHGEVSFSCSTLSPLLYLNYESITRFYALKWDSMCAGPGMGKRFNEIIIPPALRRLQQDVIAASRHIGITNYIADTTLFSSLVNDIRYFASIRLISPEEVKLLKQDILHLIDTLEQLSANGTQPETGKTVNFYVSSINFETCYTCIESPTLKRGMIKSFLLNTITSQDESTFERIKQWMNSVKRISMLISQSGEQQRILYFNQQRDTVASL